VEETEGGADFVIQRFKKSKIEQHNHHTISITAGLKFQQRILSHSSSKRCHSSD
jgi:hypothetical protein